MSPQEHPSSMSTFVSHLPSHLKQVRIHCYQLSKSRPRRLCIQVHLMGRPRDAGCNARHWLARSLHQVPILFSLHSLPLPHALSTDMTFAFRSSNYLSPSPASRSICQASALCAPLLITKLRTRSETSKECIHAWLGGSFSCRHLLCHNDHLHTAATMLTLPFAF